MCSMVNIAGENFVFLFKVPSITPYETKVVPKVPPSWAYGKKEEEEG